MRLKSIGTVVLFFLVTGGSCTLNDTIQQSHQNIAVLEDIMNADNILTVPERIWYNETPFSPQEDFDQPGLDFNLRLAQSSIGPTVAILAKYFIGRPILDYYGGQLPSPVHVVAIHSGTGQVYHRECLEDDGVPIRIRGQEDDFHPGADAKSDTFESAFFNIDLCDHLALPSDPGTYYVFLWIDDLVSSIKSAEIPQNQSRRESGLPSTQQPSEIIEFGDFPVPPSPAENKITLMASTQPQDRAIYGTWFPDPAKLADLRAKAAPYHLTLLAFNHRDRRFGWISVDVTQLPPGTNPNRFRVDPLKIVGASDMQQKVFVLAASGDIMSKVLVGRLE